MLHEISELSSNECVCHAVKHQDYEREFQSMARLGPFHLKYSTSYHLKEE